jgi:hypothetical protein
MPLITTGTVVESSDLYASKGWTTFKPVLTSGSTAGPNGQKTAVGRYIHIGNVCDYQFSITAGTSATNAGGAGYRVNVPVNANTAHPTVGGAGYLITSTGGIWTFTVDRFTAGTFVFRITQAAGTPIRDTVPTANVWGNGSKIVGAIRYATT